MTLDDITSYTRINTKFSTPNPNQLLSFHSIYKFHVPQILVSTTNERVYVNSIFVYYKGSVVTVLVKLGAVRVFTPHHLRVKAPVLRSPHTPTALFICKFPASFGDLTIKLVHWLLNTAVFHRRVQAKV